jgi:hypothetical protein
MAEFDAYDRELKAVMAFVLAMEEFIDVVAPYQVLEGCPPACAEGLPRFRQAA